MIMKLSDGTSVPVISISGTRLEIMNASRDVLTIDIDPDNVSFDKLRETFRDSSKLSKLSIMNDGAETTIGTDYDIILSISDEFREVPKPYPNYLGPSQTKEVFVVRIAQRTFVEKLLEDLKNEVGESRMAQLVDDITSPIEYVDPPDYPE